MALVEIVYGDGVLEGKTVGLSVRTQVDNAVEVLGRKKMAERVGRMMDAIHKAVRTYASLQFTTSGMAMSKVGPHVGAEGGSTEPWEGISERTEGARLKRSGYYELDGSGDKPRVWSGHSRALAVAAVQKTAANAVTIHSSASLLTLHEATRPVFVLSEISAICKAIAKTVFKDLRTDPETHLKEAAFDEGADAFGFTVGRLSVKTGRGRGRRGEAGGRKGTLTSKVVGGIKANDLNPELVKALEDFRKEVSEERAARKRSREYRKEYDAFMRETKSLRRKLRKAEGKGD